MKSIKKIISKKLIIIIIVVLTCLIFIIGYFSLYHLSGHESTYAINNAKELKDMLKSPESLIIYSDVIVVYYRHEDAVDSDGVQYYTYIEYGAENSFGGMVRDIAIFEGYTYIGTFDEIEDLRREVPNLEQNEEEKLIQLIRCQLPYFKYYVGDDENVLSFQIINKDKLLRNLQ